MQTLSTTLVRLFDRRTQPASPLVTDRENADLAQQLLLELEDQQPSPLLLNIATGFPSALLCVLAAGVLAGALAGREVSAPLAPNVASVRLSSAPPVPSGMTRAASVLAGRQAQLQAMEMQALLGAPQHEGPPPVGDTRQR